MSLSIGIRTEKIYHPDGKFDKRIILDEMAAYEANGYKVEAIVLSTEQWRDLLREQKDFMFQLPEPEGTTMFGAKIEIKNTPPWCVIIDKEF